MNNVPYCGSPSSSSSTPKSPDGVIPLDGTMTWTSDGSTYFDGNGWEICFYMRPPISPPSVPPTPPPSRPPAPPLLPGGAQISGPCALTHGGSCVTSGNYPNDYDNNEECTITNLPRNPLDVHFFETQGYGGSSCSSYDYVEVRLGAVPVGARPRGRARGARAHARESGMRPRGRE